MAEFVGAEKVAVVEGRHVVDVDLSSLKRQEEVRKTAQERELKCMFEEFSRFQIDWQII